MKISARMYAIICQALRTNAEALMANVFWPGTVLESYLRFLEEWEPEQP